MDSGGEPMNNDHLRSEFLDRMDTIAAMHRPSDARFFSRFAELPAHIARLPALLGELHLAYQGAMHATRAAVYFLPNLDTPALRQRKLQIFIDDDGLPNGDTHHYQLTRAFTHVGAQVRMADEQFGSIDELCLKVEAPLAEFMRQAQVLYPRSHGAWCIVEMLSVNWMTALANSLAAHFPRIWEEPYFAECFANRVEERHASEALSIAADTIVTRPQLLEPTLTDAASMAVALDHLWGHLDDIVLRFSGEHNKPVTVVHKLIVQPSIG